jgi:hypothetical protein
MLSKRKWLTFGRTAAAVALLLGLAACDGGLLDVQDPDNVEAGGELTPADVNSRLAGIVADFRVAYGEHILNSGLFTDEFILAGTFPTRIQIDNRNPNSNNVSISDDAWEPLSFARATADVNQRQFQQLLDEGVTPAEEADIQEAIAFGKLFSGYSRIFMSELFCQTILGGQDDLPQFGGDLVTAETEPLSSEERMVEAADTLRATIQAAQTAGLSSVENAARVGLGRALMFLNSVRGGGQTALLDEAETVLAPVPDDFAFQVENSNNTIAEENDVWQFTWQDNEALRWTIGAGTDSERGLEIWDPGAERPTPREAPNPDNVTSQSSPGFQEWFDNGLMVPPDVSASLGLSAFNQNSPVWAQTLYAGRDGNSGEGAPYVLASGWEARMIEAEIDLRRGNTGPAQTAVNNLLTDPSQSANPMLAVQSSLNLPPGPNDAVSGVLDGFRAVDFSSGTLEDHLRQMGRAYAAGLWLTSHRLHYLRRLAVEFDDRLALGLWPDKASFRPNDPGGTNAISLPLPLSEVDNNTNLDAACPSGLP